MTSECSPQIRSSLLPQGFFQIFPQGGGKMILYGLLGGKYVSAYRTCGKVGGIRGHAPLRKFDFGPFIRRNLVESGTVSHKHNLPSFIIDLRVK